MFRRLLLTARLDGRPEMLAKLHPLIRERGPHGVLFAGGMCAFGVTPLAFQGDPAGWADALDLVADLGHTIVPGHGPIGSASDVRALQAYLRACVEAGGHPEAIPPGPWDNWQGRHLDSINVERAALLAQGDDRIPSSFLAAIGAPDAPRS